MKIDMNSVLVAPKSLRVGELYTNSGPISATVNGTIDYYGETFNFTVTISGRSAISTRLIGWEDVTVPYDTCTAMKIKTKVSISDATMKITVHGVGSDSGKFSVRTAETAWGAPYLGIVKLSSTGFLKISFPNLDMYETDTSTEEAELTDYYNTR